jgi:polar amino acid transport system ATP-binding protein
MGFAREVATKVCLMHEGRVAEYGAPEQMFNDPQNPRTRAFLHSIIAAGRL